ncbi:MAG: enoyl-CoA hydratase/isomerase family protein [Syntrophobacterales bacterium]|nr:enoyl-CoA hydratase/isomerase family protein [Syntrophobacterales bacterium]
MSENQVLISRENGLATITINRPAVMNALTAETMSTLLAAFAEVGADPDIRVVLLQGAGGNFTTGADMSLLGASADPAQSFQFMKNTAGGLILAIKRIPQPVICKVRGNVYGYGCGLALAGDFVVAADEARFCEAFVNLGISLDGGASYFLPHLVGMAKAKELALLGDVISGKEAAALGLIYKSVPDSELDTETKLLIDRLASKSAKAMSSIKETLEKGCDTDLASALALEAYHQSTLLAGEELQAAISLFLESRKKG